MMTRRAVRGTRLAKWVVGASLIACFGAVLLWPTIKATLKANEAFMGLLLRYSKWRYDWLDRTDVGDGKNSMQVIIESPMGIAEDSSGAIYVSDRRRFIWKIEPSGRAVVVAGTGAGLAGLPAPGTLARDW